MEKIQSALAKARAERDGKDPKGAVPRPQVAQKADRKSQPVRGSTQARAKSLAKAVSPNVADAWKALPLLTLQPKLMKQNRIVALQGGQEAAGIDMMRTRVLQQMRDNGWRRLAITSPAAACGKSTIATNLAMSLQRQADLRTVLMELDLRRPSLTKMLGIEGDMSFAHVLEGSRPFSENAVCYGPNLAISANQRPWREPAELLSGAHIPEVLIDIETTYAPDVMIFDMPPMLVSDDMMAFARHVDCVLLVAGAESTTVKEIDICEQDLASQTNVMGVVLNKCRYMGAEYGYGYYE
ncbi:MAG: CpsD/CapB family tyrosine-protein kinase [Sulfitobacter sp.]